MWNYQNLRPIWATDNLQKGDKLTPEAVILLEKLTKSFPISDEKIYEHEDFIDDNSEIELEVEMGYRNDQEIFEDEIEDDEIEDDEIEDDKIEDDENEKETDQYENNDNYISE